MPKDFSLWGSLTKDYNVFTMVFTIISTFYFFKASYSNMIFLQVLIATTNTKLLNANYQLKAPITTPYILEGKKCMKVIAFIYIYSSCSKPTVTCHYNFSSFYG
jgi:hypothetical protein